jgi:hypothetical protein
VPVAPDGARDTAGSEVTASDGAGTIVPDGGAGDAAAGVRDGGAGDAAAGVRDGGAGDAAAVVPDGAAPDAGKSPDSATGADTARDTAAGADTATGQPDGARDGLPPGPVIPVVVNDAAGTSYSLADGQWQVYSFAAQAGQVYSISSLSGISRGYVGTSADVSASNHQHASDPDGNLAFVAPAAATYYLAVVVSGGGASGSFQVADGGQLLALGTSTVNLTAPRGDDIWFFHFPVTKGHGYRIQMAKVSGPAQPTVGLAVAPRAERASNGQFQFAAWSVSGGLPVDDTISAASVDLSYSGFYYLFIRVYEPMTLTVTLTQQ